MAEQIQMVYSDSTAYVRKEDFARQDRQMEAVDAEYNRPDPPMESRAVSLEEANEMARQSFLPLPGEFNLMHE